MVINCWWKAIISSRFGHETLFLSAKLFQEDRSCPLLFLAWHRLSQVIISLFRLNRSHFMKIARYLPTACLFLHHFLLFDIALQRLLWIRTPQTISSLARRTILPIVHCTDRGTEKIPVNPYFHFTSLSSTNLFTDNTSTDTTVLPRGIRQMSIGVYY